MRHIKPYVSHVYGSLGRTARIPYPKKAFTLIELLVVIAIVGILGAVIITVLRDTYHKARASDIAKNIRIIQQAFEMKGIEDNRSTWWLETDLPQTESFASFIGNNTGSGQLLEAFLPYEPNLAAPTGDDDSSFDFTYAYDNNGEDLVDPPDCYTYSSSYTLNYIRRGVNILVNIDSDAGTAAFEKTFDDLDSFFDDSDGPNCGRMRQYVIYSGGSPQYSFYLYALSTNQQFNH